MHPPAKDHNGRTLDTQSLALIRKISPQRDRSLSKTYQSTLNVLLLGVFGVLFLPAPGFEGRSLQGTAIGESQGPWLVQGALVDSIKVNGGLLLTLTTRQEGDPCDQKKERLVALLLRCGLKMLLERDFTKDVMEGTGKRER